MKKQKGITLVTLITIIVIMLILLGVGTKIVIDGKIFGIAEKAVNGTNNKIGEQEYKVNVLVGELDSIQDSQSKKSEHRVIGDIVKNTSGSITKAALKDELDKSFGEGKTEVIETNEGYTILVKENWHEFVIDKKGNVTTKENLKLSGGNLPGEGTEENPFKIYCIEDLILFANNVNNGTTYESKFVTLENDLNFNSFLSYNNYSTIVDQTTGMTLIESMISNTGFTPIGTSDNKFKGNFDGKNHKIYNLYENRGDNFAGLFGNVEKSTIKNLTMVNMTLKGNKNIGGIIAVARSGSKLQYLGVEGNTKILNGGTEETLSGNIGLIVANANGSSTIIERCYSTGTLTKDEGGTVGGIVGFGDWGSDSYIKQCYNKMDIVNGIAGSMNGFVIEECFHVGKSEFGGIIGQANWSITIIKNCYNIGENNAGIIRYGIGGSCFNCYSVGVASRACIHGGNYGNHIVHCFGRDGDIGNLSENPTQSEILNLLSPYNNRNYVWKEKAKIGDYCDIFSDEYMKSQAFVDELNTLIEASIEDGHVGEISNSQQNVWKRDVNNINQGYPIFIWQ